MKPLEILEAIKEDIKEKFEADPLMMRTVNLVITEYKARSERLHKPDVSGSVCTCGKPHDNYELHKRRCSYCLDDIPQTDR